MLFSYRERGRHGFVDHLSTAFVEGYTDQERPLGGKGRVEIDLHLSGEPPSWAHSYKIAYAKNSSVQDFVQYSAGGGFVVSDPEDTSFDASNKNIYVSLNYLQNHPISYVSSFGARTPEGGLNFYKFEEGDKLLVLSHGPGNSRTYENYEFDVVDTVMLGDDENPLGVSPVASNKKGQFVVLKDNPDAVGFSYQDVLEGNDSNKWNKNCIFELRTPKKTQEVDEQIYYEVSDHYRVLKNPLTGALEHELLTVTIDKGDVFFIRTGTVHAIGAGILLAEIQQTSDVTYRIFDWNRTDKNGNTRELHTELALDAIDYQKRDNHLVNYTKIANQRNSVVSSPYFTTDIVPVNGKLSVPTTTIDSFVLKPSDASTCRSGPCPRKGAKLPAGCQRHL